MNTTTPPLPDRSVTRGERALVLGGGGSIGNAWSIGILAGLAEGGIDASAADLVIGTSAGATAAAQVTARPPRLLLVEILSAQLPPRPSAGPAQTRPVVDHQARTQRIIDASSDVADMRRHLGRAAIEVATASEGATARWRSIVGARLPRAEWPEQRVVLTAVDAETGEPVLFDRDSGVDLVDAVAASCSSGGAYRIDDSWYIDGGYRANADNADLAEGYARVLVVSPFSGASRTPVAWGTHLPAQIELLQARGSRVATIFPDERSLATFGDNMMDPSRRTPAAHDGFAQGQSAAVRLSDFWR